MTNYKNPYEAPALTKEQIETIQLTPGFIALVAGEDGWYVKYKDSENNEFIKKLTDIIQPGEGVNSLYQTIDKEWSPVNEQVKKFINENKTNSEGLKIKTDASGNVVPGAFNKYTSAWGGNTQATGSRAHTEGGKTIAFDSAAHAEGTETFASGKHSHAEGCTTAAIAPSTHAEGYGTVAEGENSHAQGLKTKSKGYASHAEGQESEAEADYSHAQGFKTKAKGIASNATGYQTEAQAHHSTTMGKGTVCNSPMGLARGRYNNPGDYADIVGNGSEGAPSNAYTLDWYGNAWFKRSVRVGEDNDKLVTEKEIERFASEVTNELNKKAEKYIVTNALKGNGFGESVALTDVSPIEHNVGVKVKTKNILSKSPNRDEITYNDATDGSTTVIGGNITLVKGKTYTMSFDTEDTRTTENPKGTRLAFTPRSYTTDKTNLTDKYPTYANGSRQVITFTMTEDRSNGAMTLIQRAYGETGNTGLCSNAMIEEGAVATAYTPYVADVSAASLKQYRKNIYKIGEASDYYVPNQQILTIAENSITAKAGSGAAAHTYNIKYNYPSGKYAISAVSDGTAPRMLVRCFDENGNLLTKDDITISGWTYNQNAYKGWHSDIGKTIEIPNRVAYWQLGIVFMADAGTYVTVSNILVAKDTDDLTYEPCIGPTTHTVNADGTVEGVISIYPTTTFMTDTVGTVTDVTYNRDINKAFVELTNAIISLGGNV